MDVSEEHMPNNASTQSLHEELPVPYTQQDSGYFDVSTDGEFGFAQDGHSSVDRDQEFGAFQSCSQSSGKRSANDDIFDTTSKHFRACPEEEADKTAKKGRSASLEDLDKKDSKPVEVYTDQEKFLSNIHSRFLKYMEPFECGLMDDLRKIGAVNTDEEDEVQAEGTRIEKARKLWFILHRVPPKLFADECLPLLKETYPHMLHGMDFRCDSQPGERPRCLRHALMTRVHMKRFADIFPSTDCCNVIEYRKILENKEPGEAMWDPVFELVKSNSNNPALKQKIVQILKNIGIDRPANVHRQMRSGFPCLCRPYGQEPVLKQEQSAVLLMDHLDDNASSITGYPATADSSGEHTVVTDTDSTCSSPKTNDQVAQQDTEKAESFRSHEDKLKFEKILLKINEALVDVSYIRARYRELEGIQDQVSTQLMESSTDTPSCEEGEASGRSDWRRAGLLRDRARGILGEMDQLYRSAKKDLNDTVELQHDNFPSVCINTLRVRRHLLENDFKEAEHFFERSQKLFNRITRTTAFVPDPISAVAIGQASVSSSPPFAFPLSPRRGRRRRTMGTPPQRFSPTSFSAMSFPQSQTNENVSSG